MSTSNSLTDDRGFKDKSSLVVESGFPSGRPGQRVLNLYTRGDTRDSRSRYYAEEEEQLVFDLRMVPGPRAGNTPQSQTHT